MDAAELDRLLTAVEADGSRSAALVSLLVYNGLGIDEALACEVEDFTYQRGHRVLRIVRKGGWAPPSPLSLIVVRVLEICAAGRSQQAWRSSSGRTCRGTSAICKVGTMLAATQTLALTGPSAMTS